jgi:AmmeMemoRadiSam system protein B
VAGAFYPGSADALRATVTALLSGADPPPLDISPVALIVPHAGYRYSGPIAASGYAVLAGASPPPRRIVAIGPSHFVRFPGIAAPDAAALHTPLGLVAVDPDTPDAVAQNATAHAREHSLEVQLPFLQSVLDEFTVLPLVTGDVSAEAAAAVLDEAQQRPSAFTVISSDLSHYHDYETARRKDEATARAIVAREPGQLQWDDACGLTAVQAALMVARNRDWHCRVLDLRNSGDTSGDRTRVVGYGAFLLGPALI